MLHVYDSLVQENEAAVAGGALYMIGGVTKLSYKTLLLGNSAINGSSVFVTLRSAVTAAGPPPGRRLAEETTSAILRYEVPTYACRALNSTTC